MSIGKHLSLEEARKKGLLDRFAKQSQAAPADAQVFEGLLDSMARSSEPLPGTSGPGGSAGSSGTQTPPGTLPGAS